MSAASAGAERPARAVSTLVAERVPRTSDYIASHAALHPERIAIEFDAAIKPCLQIVMQLLRHLGAIDAQVQMLLRRIVRAGEMLQPPIEKVGCGDEFVRPVGHDGAKPVAAPIEYHRATEAPGGQCLDEPEAQVGRGQREVTRGPTVCVQIGRGIRPALELCSSDRDFLVVARRP